MPHKIIQTLPVIDGISEISSSFDGKKITFRNQKIEMTWQYGNNGWEKTNHSCASNTHLDEFKSFKNSILTYLEFPIKIYYTTEQSDTKIRRLIQS